MIAVEDYWPIIPPNKSVIKCFGGYVQAMLPDGAGGTIIKQFLIEPSDWYYRRDPVKGVIEYKDVYPTHTASMLPDYEIIWGGGSKYPVSIGSSIEASCGIAGPLGNSWFATWGYQNVTFLGLEEVRSPAGIFSNCLKLQYVQPWNKGAADGGVIWLAPKLGMVQANWIKAGVVTDNWSRLLYLHDNTVF